MACHMGGLMLLDLHWDYLMIKGSFAFFKNRIYMGSVCVRTCTHVYSYMRMPCCTRGGQRTTL